MRASEQHALRRELVARDPKLAAVFGHVPPVSYGGRGDPAVSLMRAIVGQQLSTKVAAVIWQRLETACGGSVSPERVDALSEVAMRDCGLSGQKTGYLRNIAAFTETGGMAPDTLAALGDDALVAHLTRIKGVGRWTVEMLMIFELSRPDVLPVDDLGIQNAMRRLYRMRAKGKPFLARMRHYARPWRPHRSYVTQCLWRWMDNAPLKTDSD